MNAIAHIRRARGWAGAGIIAAALLTLAVSFCLLDADEHGAGSHAMSLDLCVGLLATSLTMTLLPQLPLSGWAPAYRTVRVPAEPLHIPALPPKSASVLAAEVFRLLR